jgi:hypothetical protein
VVVLVAVSLVLILGFGALAVDLGQLYVARAELQRAADAAALAGATAYFTDAGLTQNLTVLEPMINDRAQQASLLNPTHHAETFLELADIVIGTYDFDNPADVLDTSGTEPFNAVQVTTRRTPESTNGSISMYLAGVLGIQEASVTATATAATDFRFSAYEVKEVEELYPPMLPMTLNVNLYNEMAESGPDEYTYVDGAVHEQPDGVNEIHLYSWRVNTNDPNDPLDDFYELSDQGAGNFALLDFDAVNMFDVESNIVTSLSGDQIIDEFGATVISYYTDTGEPITYELDGEAGLRVSLADTFSARIGDVVGIFLHDQVIEDIGADIFRNVGIRFGRIMESSLQGSDDKLLVFQPIAYSGPEIIVDEDAGSTAGHIGRVILVK